MTASKPAAPDLIRGLHRLVFPEAPDRVRGCVARGNGGNVSGRAAALGQATFGVSFP